MINATAEAKSVSNQQPQDSKTVDVKTFSDRRERVTVRIEPGLKEALKQYCLANGLSICHITEGLYIGFLYGVNEKINLDVKRPTMNVNVTREVLRRRRVAHEYKEEVDEIVGVQYESTYCERCNKEANDLKLARFVSKKKLLVCPDCLKETYNKGLLVEVY